MGKEKVPLLPGIVFDVDIADPKARIQAWIDGYSPSDADIPETFDSSLMRDHLKLISADKSTASAIYELKVPREFCSRTGMIHGGAAAMVIDMCTSATQAIVAKPGHWQFSGVSRTLSLTYLRPIPMNTVVVIECQVLQAGKNLATVSGKIFKKDGHMLLCVGEHNKAFVDIAERNSKL